MHIFCHVCKYKIRSTIRAKKELFFFTGVSFILRRLPKWNEKEHPPVTIELEQIKFGKKDEKFWKLAKIKKIMMVFYVDGWSVEKNRGF